VTRIAIAGLFAVALGALAGGPAYSAAAGHACAKASPADCGARRRPGIHGTVRPRHLPAYLPKNQLPENRNPLLYNLPREYNPLDFPSNDGLRQNYPGLGLYR